MDFCLRARSAVLRFFYKLLAKPLLFLLDAESAHDLAIKSGVFLGKSKILRKIIRGAFHYDHPSLRVEVAGLKFNNPLGLAAGFDKDGEIVDILPEIGFGYIEVGSITSKECQGNERPRLWRLPDLKSLVVYYGLKNKGCHKVVDSLKGKSLKIPLGLSVAMTNISENSDVMNAIEDYAVAFSKSAEVADYITINISCPNITCGEEKLFLVPENLKKLLDRLEGIPFDGPVFVKLSPDLKLDTIDEIIEILNPTRVKGIICTNLTKDRSVLLKNDKQIPELGGLSGMAVSEKSNNLIAYLYKKAGHRFVLIGCGGIFNSEDAYKKIRLGASALQLITGMIFEGPQLIGEINGDLAMFLKRDGFLSINEAVGVDSL